MLKVVADTNVLVSATISEGNEYRLLKLARLGKVKIVLSPDILKEFRDVISRPKFGFSARQIEDATRQILSLCEIAMPKSRLSVIREDPDDNIVLECALAGNADYIVSGDRHLLDLKKFRNIPVVRTSEFLRMI